MALLLKGEILLPDQRIIPGFLGDAYTDDVRATGSLKRGCNCEANSRRASERDVVLQVPVSRYEAAIWNGTKHFQTGRGGMLRPFMVTLRQFVSA